MADFQEGHPVGAALNGGLAASDLFLAGDIAKAIGKGGLYAIKGPIGENVSDQAWRVVRQRMGQNGPLGVPMLDAGQHGHHWLIPRNGWGARIPDVIKNHPLNIMAMPDVATHMRIHGLFGYPKYNLLEGLYFGTPSWAKVTAGEAAGRPAAKLDTQARRR